MPYHIIDAVNLGGLHVRTWGLMVGLGILVGALLTAHLASKRGIDPDKVWTLALVTTGGGILGSRVLWALQPAVLERTLADPLIAIQIWDGGLTFVGGIGGGLIAAIWYVRHAGLPLGRVADIVAPGFGIGLAIGRIGCFLTGLHPGTPTDLPWGIDYLGAVRNPVPLYESITGLVLAGAAIFLLSRASRPGLAALSVAAGYLIFRAGLDLLRASESVAGADPRFLGALTLTQFAALLSAPVIVIAAKRLMGTTDT